MSREVLGPDAVETSSPLGAAARQTRILERPGTHHDLDGPVPGPPPVRPSAGDDTDPSHRSPSRPVTALAVSVALVTGLLSGWVVANDSRTSQAIEERSSAVAVRATASVGGLLGGGTGPRLARLVVTVRNGGPEPVEALAVQADGGGAVAVRQQTTARRVDARDNRDLVVDVEVDCTSPSGSTRTSLRLRTRDDVEHVVDVDLDIPSLAAFTCGTNAVGAGTLGPTLQAIAVESDGDLAVRLDARFGWTPEVESVSVGDVPLTVVEGSGLDKLPERVGPDGMNLLLAAPTDCPVQWRTDAVPTQLTVKVTRLQEPLDVVLSVGPVLAGWLADHACGDEPR